MFRQVILHTQKKQMADMGPTPYQMELSGVQYKQK